MNATNSARSDSDSSGFALRRNSAVSTTVIGASAILFYYTQFAQWRGNVGDHRATTTRVRSAFGARLATQDERVCIDLDRVGLG